MVVHHENRIHIFETILDGNALNSFNLIEVFRYDNGIKPGDVNPGAGEQFDQIERRLIAHI